MDINNVFYGGSSTNALKAQEAMANFKKYEASKADESEDATGKSNEDSYTKSDSNVTSDSGIYTKENIQKTIKEIESQRTQAMQNMLTEMLGKQANAAGMSFLKNTSFSSASISDITDAQDSISDGGYWSVDSVAGRIMDMAKLLANGDSSKFETLKNAVIKGFNGAAKKMGHSSLSEMPDITNQTYDEVMKRFDKWSDELGLSTKDAE